MRRNTNVMMARVSRAKQFVIQSRIAALVKMKILTLVWQQHLKLIPKRIQSMGISQLNLNPNHQQTTKTSKELVSDIFHVFKRNTLSACSFIELGHSKRFFSFCCLCVPAFVYCFFFWLVYV